MAISFAGNLSIINATPFPWVRASQDQSSQIAHWDFPQQIDPGQTVSVHTAWSGKQDSSNALAAAGYSMTLDDGNLAGFQIQAHFDSGPQFHVLYDNTSTFGNPPGTSVNLGFADDAATPFIFSGKLEESFESSNPPANWMQQNLASIGCLPLTRLCIPASHDAGMSAFTGKSSPAVTNENTLTHFDDMGGQLARGFRYFDIRPVIAGGQFATGHYSEIDLKVSFLDSWQGGNGQEIASIVTQMNAFLDSHRELVVLDLSHTLNTDSGYNPLNQDEQNRLFRQLLGLKHRYIADPAVKDLTTLKLNDFIANGPAVVIILDNAQANEHMSAAAFANQGFYTNAQFPIFNQFADTDDPAKMSNDQITKMRNFKSGGMFLLSWTLSTVLNIRELALQAHAALFSNLWPAMSKDAFPNFIMVDAIGADSQINPGNVAALSMAINHAFNDDCRA